MTWKRSLFCKRENYHIGLRGIFTGHNMNRELINLHPSLDLSSLTEKLGRKKNNKKNNPFTLFSTSPDHPEQRPLHLIKNLIGITDTAVTNVVQLNVAQTRSTFQQRSRSLTSELLPSGQKQKNQGNQETLTQSTGEKLS